MTHEKLSRRSFVRTTSLTITGIAAGSIFGTNCSREKVSDTSTIRNYNPEMSYRRLGKTGLMVSEISIGGHWKTREGGRVWGGFANDEVPGDVVKNRTEVISRCIDHGMNYLDITTASESLSYGAALKSRREKMYIAADDHTKGPRRPANLTIGGQMANIEECLRCLGTDYLDVWRPQFRQDGNHENNDVEVCIEAFEKAHQQGKARWLGMSAHNRTFVQRVVENYPQYSVVIFPYTAKSKVKPAGIGSIDTENLVEVGTGDGAYSGDTNKSIFDAVKRHDTGVITIKPFAGGSLFNTSIKFGPEMKNTEEDYETARLTLAYILCNDVISAAVPGMTTIAEVDNNVRASAERLALMDQDGIRKLRKSTDEMWAHLPGQYDWLKDWEWV